MAITATARSAIEEGLKIQRLDYFSFPVRDLEVAQTFYCSVLGGSPSSTLPSRDGADSLTVNLFPGDVRLRLVQQDTGQVRPDDMNPHYAFHVDNPTRYDALIHRLRAWGIPVVGPMTGLQIPAPATGTPAHVQVYFDDPDGNHMEAGCHVYPFFPGMHMKPFDGLPYDPWPLQYSWREWRRTYCVDEKRELQDGAEAGFRLDCLNHYTLPVRDLARAGQFYANVLGGEPIPTFSEIYRMEQGIPLTPGHLAYLRLCDGLDRIVVGRQTGGWPPPDVHHPLQAYVVPGVELDHWMRHFASWGVPSQLTWAQVDDQESEGRETVALHFRDPDGNNLALTSTDYRGHSVPQQSLDGFALSYRADAWPPPA